MPFSRLINAAFATSTTIVRGPSPSSASPGSGGRKSFCSHGTRTLRGGASSSAPAPPQAHSAFLHLSSSTSPARFFSTLVTAVKTALPAVVSLSLPLLPPLPLPHLHRAVGSKSSSRAMCTHAHTHEQAQAQAQARTYTADLERLFHGNLEYIARMETDYPGVLVKSANEPQRPSMMILDCADSRVDEQAMFSAPLGTAFTTSNIANRFNEEDVNTNAVLAFAISSLKVRHIVVLGHYGCGGIANSMMMPNLGSVQDSIAPMAEAAVQDSMMPNLVSVQDSILPTAEAAVQKWIQPVRELYEMSLRPEIIAHREKAKLEPLIELPGIREPAFRALIEENLKLNVKKIANSRVIQEKFASLSPTRENASASAHGQESEQELEQDVFIHGWIYDMESGRVFDLGVSVGPPGREVPRSPFPLVGSSQV